MCVRLGRSGVIKPGTKQIIKTRGGTQLGLYGFDGGYQYNVRFDKLETTWKAYNGNRGILTVPSFWEKGTEFERLDHAKLKIGVIFNNKNEFAVITVDANPVVKPFHHRMPLCLVDEEEFLQGAKVVQLESGLFTVHNLIAA